MLVRRQPAGDFHLSRPRGQRTGTHRRSAIAWHWAACRSSICSAAAASRSRSPTCRPSIGSCPTRGGRTSRKSGVLNGCGKPGRTARTRPWRPFHRLTESDPDPDAPGGFYHPTRRTAAPGVPGTEVFLTPHDPGFDPAAPGDATLSVDALCLNRDLPTDLPYGGGRPNLRLVEGAASVAADHAGHAAHHHAAPAAAGKRILAADFASVAQPSVGDRRRRRRRRTEGSAAAVCVPRHAGDHDRDRGADERHLAARRRARAGPHGRVLPRPGCDPGIRSARLAGRRVVPAGSVLERFLALHATINSFTRTRAVLRGRPGNAGAWPARSGTRVLA